MPRRQQRVVPLRLGQNLTKGLLPEHLLRLHVDQNRVMTVRVRNLLSTRDVHCRGGRRADDEQALVPRVGHPVREGRRGRRGRGRRGRAAAVKPRVALPPKASIVTTEEQRGLALEPRRRGRRGRRGHGPASPRLGQRGRPFDRVHHAYCPFERPLHDDEGDCSVNDNAKRGIRPRMRRTIRLDLEEEPFPVERAVATSSRFQGLKLNSPPYLSACLPGNPQAWIFPSLGALGVSLRGLRAEQRGQWTSRQA